MTGPKKPSLIRASEPKESSSDLVAEGMSFSHPLNPNSQMHLRSLGDAVGLERIGISIIRIPPGKESFVYHMHYTEEEFVYILSGRGIAEIGDETFDVGPGDFMGFPAPSVGHHLKNPGPEELVYLSGGERRASEIADFPRINKRLVRVGMETAIYGIDEAAPMGPFPRLDGKKEPAA